MQSIKNFLLIFFAILTITNCSHKPAIIVENSRKIYNHKNENKPEYKAKHNVDSANKSEKKQQNNQITVLKGETLFSISKKHNVLMRDLIKENDLEAPYNLKAGDKLIVPQPNYYIVKNGDTLYSISRANDMNINRLIAINDLKEPYNVIEGQKLRINASDNQSTISKTTQKTDSNIASKNKQISTTNKAAAESKIDSHVTNNFSWPVNHGKIISGFGPKKGGLYNDGVNIAVKENAPIKASESGTVAYVGNELKGYGNLIIIKHPGGFLTAYAHLSKSLVKRGQEVKKLQVIANAGTTGNVSTPQLYFGLRRGRDAVNPQNYLKIPIK